MVDQIFKKRKGQRASRKKAEREIAPYRYLIVCEGSKTEPFYFEGIKRQINSKYGNKIRVENVSANRIEIDGTGRNTEDLTNYAIIKRRNAKIPYGHVWCVFDKDSFSDQQFNNAITLCNNNNIGAAWSNEAIELWFILHFEYMNSSISRFAYIDKLNYWFGKFKINNGKYEKTLEDIFDILNKHGDMTLAIKFAKKLEKKYNKGTTPSNMNPATTVYELVEELLEYMNQN